MKKQKELFKSRMRALYINGSSGLGDSGFGFSPWMPVMMIIRILVFAGLIVLGIKLVKNYTVNSSSAIKIHSTFLLLVY